jgi:hypothetical protein
VLQKPTGVFIVGKPSINKGACGFEMFRHTYNISFIED